MTDAARKRWVIAGLLALGLAVFLPGINWGLPSRRIDPALFGSAEKAWDAKRVVAAGGAWRPDLSRPADADPDPLLDRSKPIDLTATPADRAKLIRRFRHFSHQPDEMLTFRALAGMRGGSFDPRMYQYGGLWFYPVGGMLKVASVVGLVEVRADMTYYLDHPDDFGRFYVVARGYSVFWGLVGIVVVFGIGRHVFGGFLLPATAGALFAVLPVVVNGAHEAKPHLGGAVLVLAAVLAAMNYVRTGRTRWWVAAGAACGAAAGMVLSGAVAFAILPLMVAMRGQARAFRRLIGATVVGVAVYCVTNPYLVINLWQNRAIVRENLAELSQAKAISGKVTDAGRLRSAAVLIGEGVSWPVALVGAVGAIGAAGAGIVRLRTRTPAAGRKSAAATSPDEPAGRLAFLLIVPAALVLAQFIWLAGGKTGEFGRFAILPDVALAIAAVTLLKVMGRPGARAFAAVELVAVAGLFGGAYVAGFVDDARYEDSSRFRASLEIERVTDSGGTIGVYAEPAPYNFPPVDLEKWRVLLLPEGPVPTGADAPDVIVRPVDVPAVPGPIAGTPYVRHIVVGRLPWFKTRISWADKPFELLIREGRGGRGGIRLESAP